MTAATQTRLDTINAMSKALAKIAYEAISDDDARPDERDDVIQALFSLQDTTLKAVIAFAARDNRNDERA